MQKKKFWLWLLSVFIFVLTIFSLTACKGDDMSYLGTYKGGRDTFIITKEYVNINGENYTYKIVDDKIRIEGFSADLIFHNNYQVLSFEFLAEFDSGSITERNQYFNTTLYNYGNGGILEFYTFKSDGTALYVNSSDTTKNKSATYRIKDGVIEITFMEVVTFQTSKTYWYVTENGQIYYDVYVKNADTYFNNNQNNSSDSGNTDNENSSTQTTTYALNYSVNNTEYGYITGNTTQTVDENGNGTSVTAVANDGYKFTGWSDGVSTATRQDMNVVVNVNVTANFEPIKLYNFILYDESIISSIDIQENSIITLDNLTKQGYTFNGWEINGQLKQAGEAITITYNTTAYARWTIDTYNITYHLEGGTLNQEKTSFTINDLPYELPTPIPQGELSFVKWTTDEAGENEIETITELGDYTLYAHYEDSAKCLTYTYSEELQGYEVIDYTGNAKEVKIPSTYKGVAVKSIGSSAFDNCISLTSIEIPDSVTLIGSAAFYNCKSLTSIEIPDSVTLIGSSAFDNCISLTSIEIPDSVTLIGSSAFYNCKSLTSITIPNSVTSIVDCAFASCSSLTSIEIPDSVTTIGSSAFQYCDSLTSVVIPDSVTSIGDCAFYYCDSLTSIEIPYSITSIYSTAFNNCLALKTIIIDSSHVANGSSFICNISTYATDVYIRADITITVGIYNVLFNNLGKETLDGVEYYHYQIKGE